MHRITGPAAIPTWRLLIAVLAIPVFDGVLAYVSFPIVWWLGDHGGFRPIDPHQPARAFGIVAGVLGLIVMITAALPVMLRMIRRGQTSIYHFALAGVALGNLPFVMVLWVTIGLTLMHVVMGTLADHLSPPSALIGGALRALLIGSIMGAASGVVLWMVVVPGSQIESRA